MGRRSVEAAEDGRGEPGSYSEERGERERSALGWRVGEEECGGTRCGEGRSSEEQWEVSETRLEGKGG